MKMTVKIMEIAEIPDGRCPFAILLSIMLISVILTYPGVSSFVTDITFSPPLIHFSLLHYPVLFFPPLFSSHLSFTPLYSTTPFSSFLLFSLLTSPLTITVFQHGNRCEHGFAQGTEAAGEQDAG
jgi:hypothetical protein